ncbi:hypothetical protein BDW22DRAFT_1352074 [Trametopsis cervina]|nr:hypothetical protein BDW22DRAFT_1352074 [Trametopsis cervina]
MSSDREQLSSSFNGCLPTELTCLIFEHLHCSDLVACRQLCRTIKHVIDTSVVLQYKIQLHLTGMVDNPAHHFSIVEKLALLQKYQAQWYSLPGNLERVLLFDRIHLGLYAEEHVVCGTLGIGPSLDSNFYFAQLPSRIRGIPLKLWALRMPEHTGVFTLDPQQDVFVVLKKASGPEEYVHFSVVELSTGKEHPLSSCPSLPLPSGMGQEWLKIRISGPYLCVQCMESDISIIWNWHSGSSIRIEARTASFAWIGPMHLLLGIYGSTSESRIDPPKLILVDLSHPERENQQWEFLLPTILSKRESLGQLFDFGLECEPATPRSRSTMYSPDSPFHIAGEDSLIILTACEDTFRMFFLASRLFEIARKTADVITDAIIVPWKEWGSRHTHVARGAFTGFGDVVYGTRCWELTSGLVMLDFNRWHARHRMQACGGAEENGLTKIRVSSQTHLRTMAEEVEATAEEMAELCLDGDEGDGQRKLTFQETVSPHRLYTNSWGSRFSEDAICVYRRNKDESVTWEAYTL